MVLAVLLGLLASQEAQAFYNPATGRWLNRASRGITCMHLSFLSGIMVFGLGFLLGCGKPFSGDGVMADRGYWSYPRYEIAFDSLETGQFLILTYLGGEVQSCGHGAEAESGVSGRNLPRDESRRPARADLPG